MHVANGPLPAFVYERKVAIPVRDGARLAAHVYRPLAGAVATVLVRTPYGISTPQTGMAGNGGHVPHPSVFIDAGLAVVWVECRGTFASEGAFQAVRDDAEDGHDTIDWIIRQPWSNGSVGMYGASYHAMAQWAAASSGHPALKATVPTVGAMRWYDGLWYNVGGALSLSAVTTWHALMSMNAEMRSMESGDGDSAALWAIVGALYDQAGLNAPSPVSEHPLLRGRLGFDDILAHPDRSAFWDSQDFTPSVPSMTQPALFIGGWFDVFLAQQLRDFAHYTRAAGSVEARENSRLIIGPWDHDPGVSGHYPDRDFGVSASPYAADLSGEHVRHLTRWLQGGDDSAAPAPRVRLFLMGPDTWVEYSSWPPTEARAEDYFLVVDHAQGRLGAAPSDSRVDVAFDYDPLDPVPTAGGAFFPPLWGAAGPIDQRRLDSRRDIVRFVSDELTSDTTVVGPVTATLFVRSDAVDTDITAKLIDVYPDGRALAVCDGILRLRYRESTSSPLPLTPGDIYEIEIDMLATATVFGIGHRIRLDVSSSNFPRFDRNPNTGGDIAGTAIENSVTARNTIVTGPDHPSRLTLPVIR